MIDRNLKGDGKLYDRVDSLRENTLVNLRLISPVIFQNPFSVSVLLQSLGSKYYFDDVPNTVTKLNTATLFCLCSLEVLSSFCFLYSHKIYFHIQKFFL